MNDSLPLGMSEMDEDVYGEHCGLKDFLALCHYRKERGCFCITDDDLEAFSKKYDGAYLRSKTYLITRIMAAFVDIAKECGMTYREIKKDGRLYLEVTECGGEIHQREIKTEGEKTEERIQEMRR